MRARIREEECGSGWGLWAHSFGLCGESRLTAIGIGGLDRVIRDRSMCGGGAPGGQDASTSRRGLNKTQS